MNALDVPAELTLCRCLIAITDVLDVPTAFLHEAAAHSRSLQLRYEFLGRREAIKLENPVLKGGFATATRERNAGGGQDGGDLRPEDLPPGDLPPEDEGLVRVPVNSLRSGLRSMCARNLCVMGVQPQESNTLGAVGWELSMATSFLASTTRGQSTQTASHSCGRCARLVPQ